MVLLAAPSAAGAERYEIVGDSIGVGVDWAAKAPSQARNSVAIYNGWVLDQLQRSPRGATVFMSLGTNDAVGGALDVREPVEKIVATAEGQGLRLVWIGPPCVLKPWNENVKKLDAILREELHGTGVTYVSMSDPSLCDRSLRAGDGVHFNMAGYTRMWQKAATAAGVPVVLASAESAAEPVAHDVRKTAVKRKHRKKHVAQRATTPRGSAPN
jgi:lysophospholipase L1-like esterase